MAGFTAAPGARTRLFVAGKEGETLSGDILVMAGIGNNPRQNRQGGTIADPHELLIDGRDSDPLQPAGFYIPTLRPVTAWAKFAQLGRLNTAVLRVMELNLDTAPAAASAVDCFAVRVRGAVAGQLDLAMASTATRFLYNGGHQSVGGNITPSTLTGGRGILTRFRTTADLTVTSVAFAATTGAFGYRNGGAGIPKRLEILDGTRSTVLASSAIFTGALSSIPDQFDFPIALIESLELVQGTDYYVGVRAVPDYPGDSTEVAFYLRTAAVPAGGAFGGVSFPNKETYTIFDQGAHSAGTDFTSPLHPLSEMTMSTSSSVCFVLYGTPGGVTLEGEIAVDLIQTGTGGTPGAGVNVRMSYAG